MRIGAFLPKRRCRYATGRHGVSHPKTASTTLPRLCGSRILFYYLLYRRPSRAVVGFCRRDARSRPFTFTLSPYGRCVEEAIRRIPITYSGIILDSYVIMPNHVHLLLQTVPLDGRSRIIQQTKGVASKKAHFSLFQKLFYDHCVRHEDDLANIREYIQNNPLKWAWDRYYIDV